MCNELFKRDLDQREIRLFLFATELDDQLFPSYRRLHVFRETVNGRKIPACAHGEWLINSDVNYWSFPLLDFLIVNAPTCDYCMKVLIDENIIVDTRTPV